MRFPRRAAVLLISLVLVSGVAFVSRGVWLAWLGGALVERQTPVHSDVIVVLGGDLRGDRIITAAGLACQGYAPRILVSGSGPIYGRPESDLAVSFAVARGYDSKLFVPLGDQAHSTEEEASDVARELRHMGVHRFLLVTSSYHTRRAARIFRHVAPDLQFAVFPSPDPYFTVNGWWKSREGQKTFFTEWTKTVANWLGV